MPGGPLTGSPPVALFGKLPAHGDFVRRGDPALVRRLDLWLTGEVERLAMAADDLDARLAAFPTWCFRLPGDVAGVLAASHDKVGRIFPVVACVEPTLHAASDAADVLDHGLHGAAADRVAELLRRPAPAPARPDPILPVADVATGSAAQDYLSAEDDADADRTIDARWWRPDGAGPVLAFADLPTGDDFARLLAATEG